MAARARCGSTTMVPDPAWQVCAACARTPPPRPASSRVQGGTGIVRGEPCQRVMHGHALGHTRQLSQQTRQAFRGEKRKHG